MMPDAEPTSPDPTASGPYVFGPFVLDVAERRLTRDGQTVELNSRYLDVLTLMVAEPDKLISKDRFMAVVWKGIPVTDEALTQAIRSLRKALGDDASRPRFIETAPKHGYRFIAAVEKRLYGEVAGSDVPPEMVALVERQGEAPTVPAPAGTAQALAEPPIHWRRARVIAASGMIGGGAAGLVGGLLYGLVGASLGDQAGVGSASVLVLAGLTLWVGLVGGAGVATGIAAANLRSVRLGPWSILGGAAGGLLTGGLVRLIGTDAFSLLLGQSPGAITGAGEGLVLGAAVGLGVWLAGWGSERLRARRGAAMAGVCGAIAGAGVSRMGGHLMAGSLQELATRFPGSQLQMDAFGKLFGEAGFGPMTQTVSAALEGGLFAACVVGTLILALRSLGRQEGRAS